LRTQGYHLPFQAPEEDNRWKKGLDKSFPFDYIYQYNQNILNIYNFLIYFIEEVDHGQEGEKGVFSLGREKRQLLPGGIPD
jgi:hypothetical protein